jgi:hypothetical protein
MTHNITHDQNIVFLIRQFFAKDLQKSLKSAMITLAQGHCQTKNFTKDPKKHSFRTQSNTGLPDFS